MMKQRLQEENRVFQEQRNEKCCFTDHKAMPCV